MVVVVNLNVRRTDDEVVDALVAVDSIVVVPLVDVPVVVGRLMVDVTSAIVSGNDDIVAAELLLQNSTDSVELFRSLDLGGGFGVFLVVGAPERPVALLPLLAQERPD